MVQNRLRRIFAERQSAYGLWVTLESPYVTELAVAAGLDWVCVDMEHGHLDYREVSDHVRAVRGSETSVVVRVPQLEVSAIKRALDIGAHGVIIPFIQTPEELETAFQYGKYPPRGVRGIGGDRAFKWGLGFQEYLACANDETLVIPLIETRRAVENLDALLEAPGLEALFLGPADMSASYGYPGQWEAPGVTDIVLDVRARAARKGIATGILSQSVADAERRTAQGFGMVGFGSDMGLLLRSLRDCLAAVVRPVGEHLWF